MNNRVVYLILFVLSVFVALIVKLERKQYFGVNAGLDIFLGSILNYVFVTGLVAGYVTFANTVTNNQLRRNSLGLTCGAILWEINQAFIDEMVFDWNDVIASLLAYCSLVLIQYVKPLENSPSAKGAK